MKVEVKLCDQRLSGLYYDKIDPVILEVPDLQPFTIIQTFWPLRPKHIFSARIAEPEFGFAAYYDQNLFDTTSSWELAWSESDRKWAVHIHFSQPSKWNGQTRYQTWMIIERLEDGKRFAVGRPDAYTREETAAKWKLPKYAWDLLFKAKLVQLEIETWLEENT